MATTHEHESGVGHNGIDPGKTRAFVGRIERLFVTLDSERGEYMSRCKTIRQDIKAVYDDARVEGIPKKELRSVIQARHLQRKIDDLRDDLEADERETYDQIRVALGDLADTPLGGAVLAAAH